MIEHLIDELIDREGGYVDHPADRGGPTNFGITAQVARSYGWEGTMRNLPRAIASDIYRRQYWSLPGFDRVSPVAPLIAAELFDTGVNMGPKVATTFLQRALNVFNRGARDYPDIQADGVIGIATIAALKAFFRVRGDTSETVLLKAVEVLQGERYISLAETRPANEAFVFGWLRSRVGGL